jgi:hypothetical protein
MFALLGSQISLRALKQPRQEGARRGILSLDGSWVEKKQTVRVATQADTQEARLRENKFYGIFAAER